MSSPVGFREEFLKAKFGVRPVGYVSFLLLGLWGCNRAVLQELRSACGSSPPRWCRPEFL